MHYILRHFHMTTFMQKKTKLVLLTQHAFSYLLSAFSVETLQKQRCFQFLDRHIAFMWLGKHRVHLRLVHFTNPHHGKTVPLTLWGGDWVAFFSFLGSQTTAAQTQHFFDISCMFLLNNV